MPALLLLLLLLLVGAGRAGAQTNSADADAMRSLSEAVSGNSSLGWDPAADPCSWPHVTCSGGRVTAVQLGNLTLSGTLPSSLAGLTALGRLELQHNRLTGPLPSLAGLSSLQFLLLHDNQFTSMPPDFFSGLSSLQVVVLDHNPFAAWQLPDSLRDATTLVNFSANSVNLTGGVPAAFAAAAAFPSLANLALANNLLEGPLPPGLAASPLVSLWLNQGAPAPGLSGTIDVVRNMTGLRQLWLQSNNFSGPIPDLSPLTNLNELLLRDNGLTGPVPASLLRLPSLSHITLSNNLLQGPVPVFPGTVKADVDPKKERFCLPAPGDCDPRVDVLLSIAGALGYPRQFADNWQGNDPCSGWLGITCDAAGNISVVNFRRMSLSGTISPDFSMLPALQKLILSGNSITGTIPESLTGIRSLTLLDVSDNLLYGAVPRFSGSVVVITSGNPDIGKFPGGAPPPPGDNARSGRAPVGSIVGGILAVIIGLLLIGCLCFYAYKKKMKNRVYLGKPQNGVGNVVVHPRHSGSGPDPMNRGRAGGDLCVIEAGSMRFNFQLLREVTGNFSKENILGKGGFGTVYKGMLGDGTEIAVKRMECGAMEPNGLVEFRSEIDVLTKVRHRHLVSLLGYCLDGNERLLVFEYMPQGTLSHHLFEWRTENLEPLGWKRRLSIALDVARGVEYLHGLANQSFIHRDLKPSNILLGNDMKAKVADFGLVRHAPDGMASVATKLAGTFGYLAPEYAVTGRVTTKIDVYSYGVILMELITGRKALDNSQPEESVQLVTWFRRMLIKKDTFHKAIDPVINLDEENLESIITVAELAGHCCAREPYQRPVMGHIVSVLSSIAEAWKPAEPRPDEDCSGSDLNMTLPEAFKRWQEMADDSWVYGATSVAGSADCTQISIPDASTASVSGR